MIFTEECGMFREKHVLVQKMSTNGFKMGLQLLTCVEKTIPVVKRH